MKKNKNIVKELLVLLCLACFLITMLPSAIAEDIVQPMADTEFARATANLTSRKTVIYTLTTYEYKNVLAIESCWLMKKVDGELTREKINEQLQTISYEGVTGTNKFIDGDVEKQYLYFIAKDGDWEIYE